MRLQVSLAVLLLGLAAAGCSDDTTAAPDVRPDLQSKDLLLPPEAQADLPRADAAVDVAEDLANDAPPTDDMIHAEGMAPDLTNDASGNHWDATADFSSTSNPSGVWSSGWTATLGSTFHLFTNTHVPTSGCAAESTFWYDPSTWSSSTPSFWKKDGAGSCPGVQSGQIVLHGGCTANEYAVLRWTSPVAGSCTVTAQFFAGDIGDTDANILQNSTTVVYNAPSTTSSPAFSGTITVAIGDIIDFVVGTKGNCGWDNTPLTATIVCN